MKKLDLISRRILSISIGITMIVLSMSLFLMSIDNLTTAKAENYDGRWMEGKEYGKIHILPKGDTLVNDGNKEPEIQAIQVFGIGIREGNLYFGILYNNNSIGLHRAAADGEDVLDW